MSVTLESLGLGGQRIFNADNPADRMELRNRSMLPTFTEVWPRDYDHRPVGSIPGVPAAASGEEYGAPDMLIAESDYQGAIEYAHEHQTFPIYAQKASWAPDGFRYDQNGLGFCVTSDTEILTEDGFVPFPEYDGKARVATVNQETGVLEYQKPSKLHCYDYDGDMIYSDNRRVDFGVTPEHRMYVRKWDEGQKQLSENYKFVKAGDLGWYVGLMHAPKPAVGTELVEVEVPGDRAYDGDDYIALLSIIVSDGYAANRDGRISFCCFDEDRYEAVKALADRCGFNEQPSRKGVFNRWSKPLWQHIREECYTGQLNALNKKVPRIVKCASERQINLFLLWYADQRRRQPLTMFFTSGPRLADDLQELLFRVGKRSTPVWREKRVSILQDGKKIYANKTCTIVVSSTNRLCLDRKKHLRREHYSGKVYCVTVPNSTMVTRRNGTTLISSNCWTWGGTACLMDLQRIHCVDMILLAPVSMGYLVGWANRGNYLESYIGGARDQGVCAAIDGINDHRNSRSVWEGQPRPVKLDRVWDIDTRSGTDRAVQILLSCLVYGCPIYIAYNWWGHALCMSALVWDTSKPRSLIFVIRNSHNESDFILLEGNKGVPDEMYAFVSLQLGSE